MNKNKFVFYIFGCKVNTFLFLSNIFSKKIIISLQKKYIFNSFRPFSAKNLLNFVLLKNMEDFLAVGCIVYV